MMLVHGDQSYASTTAEVGKLIVVSPALVRKRPARTSTRLPNQRAIRLSVADTFDGALVGNTTQRSDSMVSQTAWPA